jgi:indolepyruvate ferredoxin oxidoreductase alpha subunit
VSSLSPLEEPAHFDYARLAHPPATFRHEKLKLEQRLPAARDYIVRHGLNELHEGTQADIGIIVQGGLTSALMRSLQQFGLADAFGVSELPLLILNVTYPLVPEQIADFARGKRAVLVIEEGSPEYIEQDIATLLRRRDVPTALHGKDMLVATGEVTPEVMMQGLLKFFARHFSEADTEGVQTLLEATAMRRTAIATRLDAALPARPPGFCIGCPERPVFSALKLVQQELGPVHVAADIGCHSFATFEPFSQGHSILGYGMSLASRAGVSPMMSRRVISIMGDGGFWHNGLLTGVQSALFNGDDAVLLIFKNGYTSATGTQEIISTPDAVTRQQAGNKLASLTASNRTIEDTLAGLGVKWLRTVHSYRVAVMRDVVREAMTTEFDGLKVIIAEGECQLERQRRIRPWLAALQARGERVTRVKYGVDEDVCNGDHACMRLSGCPTLTLKDNPDPLKVDPVATVIDGCVGCGLCGENAHAATLCPSFYRAEVIQNPRWHERLIAILRTTVLRVLQPA